MSRINLIRRITVYQRPATIPIGNGKAIRQKESGRVVYSWLVYRWTRLLVPGVGWINSYRQEIPVVYHRVDMRPRLRRVS